VSFDLPYYFSYGRPAANALFLSPKWSDAATMTASSEQGALPIESVQAMDPTKVWRATGCAAEWIAWDFGSAVISDAIVAIAHNFSEGAMLRLRLAGTAANVTAAPEVDTGFVSAWPTSGKPSLTDWTSWLSLVRATNPVAYRYGRLDIEDIANPDGYVQIGRLITGRAFVPEINIDVNPSIGLITPDEAGRTPFNQVYGDTRGAAARALQLPMSCVDEAEMATQLFELKRYCGLARDFAFCLDPSATTRFYLYSGQFRFGAMSPFQSQPLWNATAQVWQTTLSIEEVL
jgi:hypothetical protein